MPHTQTVDVTNNPNVAEIWLIHKGRMEDAHLTFFLREAVIIMKIKTQDDESVH